LSGSDGFARLEYLTDIVCAAGYGQVKGGRAGFWCSSGGGRRADGCGASCDGTFGAELCCTAARESEGAGRDGVGLRSTSRVHAIRASRRHSCGNGDGRGVDASSTLLRGEFVDASLRLRRAGTFFGDGGPNVRGPGLDRRRREIQPFVMSELMQRIPSGRQALLEQLFWFVGGSKGNPRGRALCCLTDVRH